MIPAFKTTFAVPLTCDACVEDVKSALSQLDGIESIEANIPQSIIAIKGTASPSSIVQAIESTGRDAILRGSGESNTAAVCILETHSATAETWVRGLVRIVQVSALQTSATTVFDVSLHGITDGNYLVTIRSNGDISRGAASTGPIWDDAATAPTDGQAAGIVGTIQVNEDGRGSLYVTKALRIWELIGRSMVVAQARENSDDDKLEERDPNTLVGVIARSAGVWDNDKVVCSCNGDTVWQERKKQVKRGMV